MINLTLIFPDALSLEQDDPFALDQDDQEVQEDQLVQIVHPDQGNQ
jgi:hypothetical protein